MTQTPVSRGLAAGLGLVLCTLGLSAAPGFWQIATQADFLRGQVDQLSIDQHGRVTLGPTVERVFDGAVSVVWTMVHSPDGTAFVGTGHDGKVFKVSAGGQGELFYDSPELEVHALAPAPDGGLYVGTSPDGRIYRVSASGQADTFFDPDDKYIWALATDARGVVYAATGDKGRVYRITPDGKGDVYFETKAAHAMTLAFDADGRVIIGTGGPGRVFRVDAAGKGFLLVDSPYQEVRALRLADGGVIYAAALNGRPQGGSAGADSGDAPPAPPPPTPSVSTEIMSFAIIDVPVAAQASPAQASSSGGSSPAGAVYRIQPDGLWDAMWESKDDSPYDLQPEPDGSIVVATGHKGKVFRLSGDPVQAVLLARVPAQHATVLHRGATTTRLATANPGLLVEISNARARSGSYESEVKDAGRVATWGVVSWRATTPPGTTVDVQTRSGNTPTPDDAWSDWSRSYGDAAGSPIASPNARYLQWRAILTGTAGAAPTLTSLSAAYLPRNVRPRVESITVHPPGVVFQKPFSTGETEIAGFDEDPDDRRLAAQAGAGSGGAPTLGRRIYQRGLQTLQWKADDENGDELVYEVHYRREGEAGWRPLKAGVRDSLLVWDTTSVPNGTYVVKVVASDARANGEGRALAGELESASFDIDNTAPVVTMGAVRREGEGLVVPVEIRDADSPLRRVEYSIDAGRWQAMFPADGILDSRHERFELRLDVADAGRMLVVRVADALNNVGSGEVRLPAAR